ncbi:DUF3619 family protein [Gulbenkiania mobilis]|uniref:DUF3619 family protein n=1 Tax=Gulbenkiania mobilis TaxID=397457 RepID=UPI0006BBE353|nr:DUF3619 family protein [Gulbenkiania mobilis]
MTPHPEDNLPRSIRTALDHEVTRLPAHHASKLAAARQLALVRLTEQQEAPAGWREQLALWGVHHTQALRRGTVALTLAAVTSIGLWAGLSMSVEEESADVALLSHELPLEAFLDPGLGGLDR